MPPNEKPLGWVLGLVGEKPICFETEKEAIKIAYATRGLKRNNLSKQIYGNSTNYLAAINSKSIHEHITHPQVKEWWPTANKHIIDYLLSKFSCSLEELPKILELSEFQQKVYMASKKELKRI